MLWRMDLTSRANFMHLLVNLWNVFIHAVFTEVASHGSEGQWGIHLLFELMCCDLNMLQNKAKANKHKSDYDVYKPIWIQHTLF